MCEPPMGTWGMCAVAALQDLSRLSVEAGQLRAAVEEARAAAEDARRGRAALQVQDVADMR